MLQALELLKDCTMSQADFLQAVLAAGYGAGMGKLDHEYGKIRRAREKREWQDKKAKERAKRLRNFLYQMKHDGLIELDKKNNLTLSESGGQKISKLKSAMPNRHYQKESSNRITIISFDIPEKLRPRRDWLREVMKNLGFKMIHQSVWIGKKKIPTKFIKDLEDMKILEHVEIFQVTKEGTLKKI